MRLIFIGFGTVGQGLAELLLKKKDELFSKVLKSLRVKL
jgi:homoserine dehydrogenase